MVNAQGGVYGASVEDDGIVGPVIVVARIGRVVPPEDGVDDQARANDEDQESQDVGLGRGPPNVGPIPLDKQRLQAPNIGINKSSFK